MANEFPTPSYEFDLGYSTFSTNDGGLRLSRSISARVSNLIDVDKSPIAFCLVAWVSAP